MRTTPIFLALGSAALFMAGCAPPDAVPRQEAGAMPESAPRPVAGRSTVYAPRGMVATSQPLASAAALEILRSGGNAFDAAVAASAVLSLVEPHMTGLGGDLFALFWSAREDRLVGLDASGRAGADMTPERIRADGFDDVPYQGPGAVTVPGAIGSNLARSLDRILTTVSRNTGMFAKAIISRPGSR